MHRQSDLQLTSETWVRDSATGLQTSPASSAPVAAQPFPGLSEIIRLVDDALALRRTDAVHAHLLQALPALIGRLRNELPGELLRVDRQGYRRFELHHCPISGYQILAMVWGPGQGTPIHDHNDLWGVEAVMHGELQVARYRPVEVAGTALRLQAADVVELRSGDIELIEAEHGLHLCRNPSPRAVSVSLHIYGRPLDSFGIYEDQGDGWHLRREHTPRLESLGSR